MSFIFSRFVFILQVESVLPGNLDFFRWFLSMVRTDRKSRDDSVECVIIILDEGPCSSGNLLVKDVGTVGRILWPYQSEL